MKTLTNPATPAPEHQIRRPGYKSTEFWFSLCAVVLPFVLPALSDAVADILAKSPYAAFAAPLAAAAYSISRAIVKQSRNMASGNGPQTAGTIVNEAPLGDVGGAALGALMGSASVGLSDEAAEFAQMQPEFGLSDGQDDGTENQNIEVINDADDLSPRP